MKVVLDCNVLISAGRADGVCRKFINEAVWHHEIILSTPILSEYITVVERPKFAPFLSTLKLLIQDIKQFAVLSSP